MDLKSKWVFKILFISVLSHQAHSHQEHFPLPDQLPYTPAKRYIHIVEKMKSLAQQYSSNVELFELGVNDSNEMIYGLKIGHGDLHNLVVATHHGNEYGSTEVAEAFASDLSLNPIEGQTTFVIPVLNTWGYDRRQRREQARGSTFDPNRDYPGPCGTDGPYNLKSTRALADFVEQSNIVNSVTLHTFYPAILYPWGISTNDIDTPYTSLFLELGALAAFQSGYKVANSTKELYPADGTFEDYAFWRHGIWSLLFEMGTSHSPSQNSIDQMVRTNVPGLRNLFLNSPTVRAEHHQFNGQCNGLARLLDRRDE